MVEARRSRSILDVATDRFSWKWPRPIRPGIFLESNAFSEECGARTGKSSHRELTNARVLRVETVLCCSSKCCQRIRSHCFI